MHQRLFVPCKVLGSRSSVPRPKTDSEESKRAFVNDEQSHGLGIRQKIVQNKSEFRTMVLIGYGAPSFSKHLGQKRGTVPLLYSTVWNGLVEYGVVWYRGYGTARDGIERCCTVWYHTVRFGEVECGIVWYGTIWYGLIRSGAIS